MRSCSCSLTIAKAVKNVLHCRAGKQCIFNYNLFSLPLILIASSCFNFNDAIPMGRERFTGVVTPQRIFQLIKNFLQNIATIAVNLLKQ